MKKQFVVLGLGSFGASVAVTLQKLGCDVVAVDQDMELVSGIADRVTYAMQADDESYLLDVSSPQMSAPATTDPAYRYTSTPSESPDLPC